MSAAGRSDASRLPYSASTIALGLTDGADLSDHPDHEQAREMNRSLRVVQRYMMPDDLIGTLLFLASPDSDFLTGQMINVDSGRSNY